MMLPGIPTKVIEEKKPNYFKYIKRKLHYFGIIEIFRLIISAIFLLISAVYQSENIAIGAILIGDAILRIFERLFEIPRFRNIYTLVHLLILVVFVEVLNLDNHEEAPFFIGIYITLFTTYTKDKKTKLNLIALTSMLTYSAVRFPIKNENCVISRIFYLSITICSIYTIRLNYSMKASKMKKLKMTIDNYEIYNFVLRKIQSDTSILLSHSEQKCPDQKSPTSATQKPTTSVAQIPTTGAAQKPPGSEKQGRFSIFMKKLTTNTFFTYPTNFEAQRTLKKKSVHKRVLQEELSRDNSSALSFLLFDEKSLEKMNWKTPSELMAFLDRFNIETCSTQNDPLKSNDSRHNLDDMQINKKHKISEIINSLLNPGSNPLRLPTENRSSITLNQGDKLVPGDYMMAVKKKYSKGSGMIFCKILASITHRESKNFSKIKICKFLWSSKPHLFINIKDTSEHEENKHLKKLDKFKDSLLASVTHDLRTPLNIVEIMIESAKNQIHDSKQLLSSLEIAEVNAKLLSNLISDILDYSLFKENRMKLFITTFNLDKVLREVVFLISIQARNKHIRVSLKNKCEKELEMINDNRRLKQILINLLTNALKFTKKGGKIRLNASYLEESDLIRFDVKDSGVGMTKEVIDNLFKPFSSFDNKEKMNQQGIGLGLHICRNITRQIGPFDEIIVHSIINKGSKFTFFVFPKLYPDQNQFTSRSKGKFLSEPEVSSPTRKHRRNIEIHLADKELSPQTEHTFTNSCDHSSMKIADIPLGNLTQRSPFRSSNNKSFEKKPQQIGTNFESTFTQPKHGSLFSTDKMADIQTITHKKNDTLQKKIIKVMLVDDNIFNTMVLEAILKKMERFIFQILRAFTGVEAVQIFKNHNYVSSPEPIQLIFMDYEMPEMNGCEATVVIRAKIDEEDYENSVIAGCTANMGKEDETRCFESGMDFFLPKPVTDAKIRGLLEQLYPSDGI